MARDLFRKGSADLPVLVIGLGRFGAAVANSIVLQGGEVLAVDADERCVQRFADQFTHVIQADTTDDDALAQMGVDRFQHAVVAIGSDIEASVLTTLTLAKAGVPSIWARAVSPKHGEILKRVGAHRVVYPQSSVGEQVAHAIIGGVSQYLEFEDGFAVARMTAPRATWNKTLHESGLLSKYSVTIVGVKRAGKDFMNAQPDTHVEPGDEFVVSGHMRRIELFWALTSE